MYLNKPVVFVPLAMNQTSYYEGIAKELEDRGGKAIFICCHERSHHHLKSQGFTSYNFHKIKRDFKKKGFNKQGFESILSELNIKHPKLYTCHEKEAYLINSDEKLDKKFYFSLQAMKTIFADIVASFNDVTVIQETGGFISVLSAFFNAKSLSLNHFFLEPSFFRGRIFFIKNQVGAYKVDHNEELPLNADMLDYLENTIKSQNIVIPTKDKHHYRGALGKFFNAHNFKRFFQKNFDKYILRYEEEFQYIGVHFQKHFMSIVNNIRLKSKYTNCLPQSFVYYPLHVPADMALTIRATQYLDQCNLVEQIAKSLPAGLTLCIKEHPAMIGAIPFAKLANLLERNKNICLLSPKINNYKVMGKTKAVFTVNSKAGAEASLLGIPVFGFGDAFYRNSPDVKFLNSAGDLFDIDYQQLVGRDRSEPNKKFFQSIWDNSEPGELYLDSKKSYFEFLSGLEKKLSLS